ncbi:MAG TPA: hypothetical protein VF763_02400 [Candidatus Limnocylindrales bacterium]
MASSDAAWVEDLVGGDGPDRPGWLLDRRTTLRLVAAAALACGLLFTAYVRVAYGVWTPVDSPVVIDGYRVADGSPVSLAELRAWAGGHGSDPRPPLILEPLLGRLPLSGHAWDGRHVAMPLPAALWLHVGPDRYLRYERPPAG